MEDDCDVMFGDGIQALDQEKDGVRVTFEGGQIRRFDLVIGADGVDSTVRRLTFGPQERYGNQLGYIVAAFEVPVTGLATKTRMSSMNSLDGRSDVSHYMTIALSSS